MTELPQVPPDVRAGVLSLLDLFDKWDAIPKEVKAASKTIREILEPPKQGLNEKLVAYIATKRLTATDSFQMTNDILDIIVSAIGKVEVLEPDVIGGLAFPQSDIYFAGAEDMRNVITNLLED
jgi:hypothetical protein